MRYIGAVQFVDPTNLPKANDKLVESVISDFFILMGAVALLMLTVAGIRYIFARGNPESTTKAKNMIQYSLIGLILAALAESIVAFVLNRSGS